MEITRSFRAIALLAAVLVFLLVAAPRARATGIPVVDVLCNGNIVGQTTMQLTEFARQIENQAQQIEQYATQIKQLTAMINQGIEVARIAGDPAKLLELIGVKDIIGMTGLAGVTEILSSSHSVSEIFSAANSLQSLANSGAELYSSGKALGETTIAGVKRDVALYKNFAAMEGIFNQVQSVRRQDRLVQQAMTSKISSLTQQFKSAVDNATRETLLAGIHAAHATMAASTAEVQKAQADYLLNERQRRVQEEKTQMAAQEDFDTQVAAARREHSERVGRDLDQQRADARADALRVESRSPGLTPNGEEIIRIPTN